MAPLRRYVVATGIVAHSWMHVVYVATSQEWFGAEAGWSWNGTSWLLSGPLSAGTILQLATVLLLVAALGLAVGALAYLFNSGLWRPVLTAGAGLSALTFLVLWNGEASRLVEQGLLGVGIDLLILAWVVDVDGVSTRLGVEGNL